MKEHDEWNRSKWLCGLLLVPMGMAVRVPLPDSLVEGFADSLVTAPTDSLVAPSADSLFSPGETVPVKRTTTYSFAGGGGRHFREVWLTLGYDDCGYARSVPLEIEEEFAEIGGAIDHQVSNKVHLGLRAGYVWGDNTYVGSYDTTLTRLTHNRSFFHISPSVSSEGRRFGCGVGAVFSGQPLATGGSEDYPTDDNPSVAFAGHIRFGPLSTAYVKASWWEGVPLYSGGGMLNAGLGIRPVRSVEMYAGWATAGPYFSDGLLARVTADVSPTWSIYATGRYPKDWRGHGDEFGLSAGMSYRLER